MIAIVGAGISGLTLAHELAARGVPHVVLEKDGRVGGVIRTGLLDGHQLEWGPQRTRLVGPIRQLIADVGLTHDVIVAPPDLPLFVYRDGRLRAVPRSLTEFAASDLISLRGRLRLIAEPFTGGARMDESVAEYFTRKVGHEAYANLIGPLYGGLYASDPADMVVGTSVIHALRDMGVGRSMLLRAIRRGGRIQVPAACSFVYGMQALPDALYAKYPGVVRLRTEVQAIVAHGDGFALHTSGGRIHADRVVITTDARAAASMLERVAPESARVIGSLHYNPLAIVHLHTTAALPRALGYQVSFEEHLFTRGVTFNDAMFRRRGVYTAYLGGAQHPEVVDWDDPIIGEKAFAEFRLVTGADARVISVARTAMPAWDRSWSALAGLERTPGIHFCANWESRPGLPGRLARARRLASLLPLLPDHPSA